MRLTAINCARTSRHWRGVLLLLAVVALMGCNAQGEQVISTGPADAAAVGADAPGPSMERATLLADAAAVVRVERLADSVNYSAGLGTVYELTILETVGPVETGVHYNHSSVFAVKPGRYPVVLEPEHVGSTGLALMRKWGAPPGFLSSAEDPVVARAEELQAGHGAAELAYLMDYYPQAGTTTKSTRRAYSTNTWEWSQLLEVVRDGMEAKVDK